MEYKNSGFCEIKVKLSMREKKKVKKLAKTLNMTISGLVMMMIGDTIKDKPILDRNHKKTLKRAGKGNRQESDEISVHMPIDYRDKIMKALEDCEYDYYMTEFVQECIRRQMRYFDNFFVVEAKDSIKWIGKDLETYIVAKHKLLGVSAKQIERFYIGKYVNSIIGQGTYEREVWIEPQKIRERYGLSHKEEIATKKKRYKF